MTFLLDEPWLLSVAVCIALITSSVLGYWVAVSTRINEDSHHHEHITGLREGLFVLLGLLLGFTVAIVLPRFDDRRQLVIDEANAIGTTALRAETLPEPQRDRTLELLREYVVVRRDFARETLLDQAARIAKRNGQRLFRANSGNRSLPSRSRARRRWWRRTYRL